MTPEEINKLVDQKLEERLKGVKIISDRVYFERDIELAPNTRLKTGATTKLGFFGVTVAGQQGKINDPVGGLNIDTEARAEINNIIDVLEAFGLTSST